MARLETELLRLERELHDRSYCPGPHLDFVVRDPKRRTVSAAPFRDRVVHHALFNTIGPVFERGFVADSYANRTGLGTHKALARYEHHRDRHRFVLRADVALPAPGSDVWFAGDDMFSPQNRPRGLPLGNLPATPRRRNCAISSLPVAGLTHSGPTACR